MAMPKRKKTRPPRNDTTTITNNRQNRTLPFFSTLPLLLLLLLPSFAAGLPTSYFPLNSQLPPVARVGEAFSFVFSPLTFSSSSDSSSDGVGVSGSKIPMRYALGDGAPAWLQLDSDSRTLSGTPDDDAVPADKTLVGVPVVLIATDDTGSAAVNVTLVVSRSRAPTVRVPLEEQIDTFGPWSPPSSVLFHPSTDFSFKFDVDTFVAGSARRSVDSSSQNSHMARDDDGGAGMGDVAPQLNYYAVSGDNAPLPSWIMFDAGSLVFSGTTPPFESLIQPPQTFDFKLVASDVVGFSSTSMGFSIVVGTHELTAEEPVVKLNATIGKKLEYRGLPDLLRIDKKPLGPDSITSIRADGLPTWLSFNETTWEVSGTPDTKAIPTNVTVSVVDKFLDTLNLTLAIEFAKLFVSDLPGLNVSAGDDFSFDLNRFLFAPGDIQLTTQTDAENSWVGFDDATKILSGTVPKPQTAGFSNEVRVTLVAEQRSTKAKETKTLDIHVDVPPQPTRPNTKDNRSRRDLYWLLVIPILVVAVVLIAAIFAVRRRRERQMKLDFSEVSAPMSGPFTGIEQLALTSHPYTPTSLMPSNLRAEKTMSDQSLGADQAIPHALTLDSGVVRTGRQGDTSVEAGESHLAGQSAQASPVGTDEAGLLSDTSIGDDVYVMDEVFMERRNPRGRSYGRKIGLDVPIFAEPFSIQPTPDLAYNRPARKYDYVSDDGESPTIGYNQGKLGEGEGSAIGFRGIKNRLSKAWKRGSMSPWLDDTKRSSQLSASTDVTARTSILTSGITGEAATAHTSLIARPTVIHIPGRPGEVRRVSRRTEDSATFFGGRSVTKPYRNFGLMGSTVSEPRSPPRGDSSPAATVRSPDSEVDEGGKSSWDQKTRDSLGIAYGDVIPRDNQNGQLPAETENWNAHRTDHELLSSARWPMPITMRGGGDASDRFRTRSKPPQLLPQPPPAKPPMTPATIGKARASSSRGGSSSRSGSSSVSHMSSTNPLSTRPSSRDERLRMSRSQEQKALEGSRAMMMTSRSPMPGNGWAARVDRQLFEMTPSRTSRAARLADRLDRSRAQKTTLDCLYLLGHSMVTV